MLFRGYPQALGLFGKSTAQINLHFLMAYPTTREAHGLTRAAFEAFCREHRCWKRKVVLFRRSCDHEFQRIVQQFARASTRQSGWALAYWHKVRPRCRSDSDAYRCLANQRLAIIWRMWQDSKTYDETYHLQQCALRRRPKS